jgi:transposase
MFRILSDNNFQRLRNDSRFLREYGSYFDSKSKERVLDLKKTNQTLRSFVTEKKTGGQRLTQAAAILLLTPDPITDAAAIPVLVAAQVVKMRSKKQSDMQRVLESANEIVASIFSLAKLS